MNWGRATDVILFASFAVLAVFVILGLSQLIQRKSFSKIDRELVWMFLPLALMAVTYVIFDHLLIWNTRPNGSGEASFPSTHVMIVATIFMLTAIVLPKYVKSRAARICIDCAMLVLIILTAIGRVFANMHWLSDVTGALIFATIFATIYYLIIKRYHHV